MHLFSEISAGSSVLYQVFEDELTGSKLPSNTYIIANLIAHQIHFTPLLIGSDLRDASLNCTKEFLRAAYRMGLLTSSSLDTLSQVLVLSGGMYYYLNEAFLDLFGSTINTGFIGIRRKMSQDRMVPVVEYTNLEGVLEFGTIIITDTIGTGATLREVISVCLHQAKLARKTIDRIVIYSIAAATEGVVCLGNIEDTLLRPANISLYVFVSQCLLGIANNRIDMKYLLSDSIIPEQVKAAIITPEEELVASEMCAIWDWGQRNRNPSSHLRCVMDACDKLLCEQKRSDWESILYALKGEAANLLNKRTANCVCFGYRESQDVRPC